MNFSGLFNLHKSGMEYAYSSIHMEKYKFMFTAGVSQNVVGNGLHIFTQNRYLKVLISKQVSSFQAI